MDNQDYIRKAVELADGWRYFRKDSPENPISYYATPVDDSWWNWDSWHPCHLDALAAQLVRQVDTLEKYHITYSTTGEWVRVSDVTSGPEMKVRYTAKDSGRTMNTIKAIVDSNVLGANND